MSEQEEIRISFLQLFVKELVRNKSFFPEEEQKSKNEQPLFLPMITLKDVKPFEALKQIKMQIQEDKSLLQKAKPIGNSLSRVLPFQEPNAQQAKPQASLKNPQKPIPSKAPIPPRQIRASSQTIDIRKQENMLMKELFEKNISHMRQMANPRSQSGPLQQNKPQNQAASTPSIKSQVSKSTTEKIIIQALGRLNPLLNDFNIQTIECPGPNKPVLVYKSGIIQTTNLTFTTEEINKIMKEISEKTRIPLISGIFKAAWEDYIVTAVMSEFVGTRFIIQKKQKEPASQPQPSQTQSYSLVG